jgi:23S rRNA (cytosine1962-C5)-methyltransferase
LLILLVIFFLPFKNSGKNMSLTYPNADKRIKAGHLWVYSNEIDTNITPLRSFSAGEFACLLDHSGKALGIVGISPNGLIAARLLTRHLIAIDVNFFEQQLKQALLLRSSLFEMPHYRWVHGEGDFLPGLVIDRFGDDIVVQCNTASMDACRHLIIEAIEKLVSPRSIILRNDSRGRELEGLEKEVLLVHGDMPTQLLLSENGVSFAAPTIEGQKTGWFYDHRDMRHALKAFVANQKVLDVFAYLGSFGVQAASFGASQVTCVDISSLSATWVAQNAELNGVSDRVSSITGDAFEVMEQLLSEGQRFGVVVIDPPAFIPKAKDHAKGLAAYQKLNALAIRLTQVGGFVFSGSCSMHLTRDELLGVAQKAARANDRRLQLIQETHQAIDHPIHPAIKETQYLKGLVFRVLAS